MFKFSSDAYSPSLAHAVTDTLTKPMFADVPVTGNWSRTPRKKIRKKSTPLALPVATTKIPNDGQKGTDRSIKLLKKKKIDIGRLM